jgi:DMSO/TMAO reductase YedYZ molybdopterin-dependent catalytic subunit
MADGLTYLAHRTLLPGQSLAREYSYGDVSSFPATGTVDTGDAKNSTLGANYRQLQWGKFADWRLSIEGTVERPGLYSLNDLKRFQARSQITRHTCEEGWTAIAQWTGVPLSRVLLAAGIKRSACCVCLYAYDDMVDSIDMLDAFHPQAILAYGMNGRDLPLQHGAPVRLRVETQIGYKSVKYLQRLVVKDVFDDGGPQGNPQNGWAWYTGI